MTASYTVQKPKTAPYSQCLQANKVRRGPTVTATMQRKSQSVHSRPVMSAGMDPEVDASASCAPPPWAYFFSPVQPEETPLPEDPSPLPPSPPVAMLVTLGTAPPVLLPGASGSGEMLEMPDEPVGCCVPLLLESASV